MESVLEKYISKLELQKKGDEVRNYNSKIKVARKMKSHIAKIWGPLHGPARRLWASEIQLAIIIW